MAAAVHPPLCSAFIGGRAGPQRAGLKVIRISVVVKTGERYELKRLVHPRMPFFASIKRRNRRALPERILEAVCDLFRFSPRAGIYRQYAGHYRYRRR